MGQKSTITDWDIQALVDNELSPAEEEMILNAIESDVELQRRYNSLIQQKQMLQLWWKDH